MLSSVEFLEYLCTVATPLGAVLIFDEVMTSRIHWRGLQAKFKIKLDMSTFEKYLAGGMSFGAFGGKKDIMDIFNKMCYSGTFNNNILSMAGDCAAFRILTLEVLGNMNMLGDNLRMGTDRLLEATNGGIAITGVGSLMFFHCFRGGGDDLEADMVKELFFFYMMVEEGIYLASRGFMALTIVHETPHIMKLL